MPHIHTDPGQYDATASAFIIRTDGAEPQLLLHLHKKLNKWMQPGGHVELNETPWQAVLHEIKEETGYNTDQLQLLQPHVRLTNLSNAILHPVPVCENTHDFSNSLDHRHTDRAYAFITDMPPKDLPADGESTTIKWFSADEVLRMSDDDTIANIREIAGFIFGYCLPNWQTVPLSDFKANN